MQSCPECGEDGIPEHSVIASGDAIQEVGLEKAPRFSRCRECWALFARKGIDSLTPADPDALGERVVFTLPPWKGDAAESQFELSWDVVDFFYEELTEQKHLDPLRALVAELRPTYERKLRAGNAASSLVLSRSKVHGLREGQSHLAFHPEPDGRVRVEGMLDGTKYRFGPVPCRFAARIRRAIEGLAALPVD